MLTVGDCFVVAVLPMGTYASGGEYCIPLELRQVQGMETKLKTLHGQGPAKPSVNLKLEAYRTGLYRRRTLPVTETVRGPGGVDISVV